MKRLLLVTGDLAAGKTTFARMLSERYGAIMFDKDSVKEILGDTVGFSTREENLRLSRATAALMRHIFKAFSVQGTDLILEANFHTDEMEALHDIAREAGYEALTVVLRGETAMLHGRYMNRIAQGNRHPVHLSTTFDVFSDFEAYLERGRGETVPGRTFILDAKDFSYQTDDRVLSEIDAFMNGGRAM